MRSLKAIAVVVFLLPVAVRSQVVTSVSGTVKDPSGAAVAGAVINLTAAGKPNKPALSTAEGSYTIAGIEAGSYQLEVTAPGFAAFR